MPINKRSNLICNYKPTKKKEKLEKFRTKEEKWVSIKKSSLKSAHICTGFFLDCLSYFCEGNIRQSSSEQLLRSKERKTSEIE